MKYHCGYSQFSSYSLKRQMNMFTDEPCLKHAMFAIVFINMGSEMQFVWNHWSVFTSTNSSPRGIAKFRPNVPLKLIISAMAVCSLVIILSWMQEHNNKCIFMFFMLVVICTCFVLCCPTIRTRRVFFKLLGRRCLHITKRSDRGQWPCIVMSS